MTSRGADVPVRLDFDGPLEWERMLAYFEARAIPGVEHVADGAYRRTVVIDGRAGVIELRQAHGGPNHATPSDRPNHLTLSVSPNPSGALSDAVVSRARRIFSLHAPVEDAVRHLRTDPVIGHLVAARPGLRVPGTWDPYETGIRAIVGQQISVAGATTIIGRIAQRLGEPLNAPSEPGLTRAFPSPDALAAGDLAGIGMPSARVAAIQRFAEAVRDGQVRLDRSMPVAELVASITAIAGLGPWTAEYIALRLGEPDAFPATDLGLRRAYAEISHTSAEPLGRVAARWSPWRATAAVHLWQA